MQKHIILIIALATALPMMAQVHKIETPAQFDSVDNALRHAASFDEKAKVYDDLFINLSRDNMVDLVKYSKRGIADFEHTQRWKDLYNCYRFCGLGYTFLSQYDSALVYYTKSQKMAFKSGDERLEGDSYFGLAYLYERWGKYVTALDYYVKHLAAVEKIKDYPPALLIRSYGNVGEINRRLHNYKMAVEYLEKGIALGKEKKIDLQNFRLWHCYSELGNVYYETGQIDKALSMIESINPEYKKEQVENSYAFTMLARIYLQKKDYAKALENAQLSLEAPVAINDYQLFANSWNVFSEIYMAMQQFGRAKEYALKAWEADSINIDNAVKISYNLAQCCLKLGDNEQAERFLRRNAELNDEYSERTMLTTIADLQVKYDSDKKELRIAALENQRKLSGWLGVAIIALLLTLLLLLINVRRLSRQKITQLEQEKQISAQQSVIEGENKERRRLARDLHDGLGGMLSAVRINLDNPEQQPIARDLLGKSIEELRRLAHNLMPASLKYGLHVALEDFCNSIPNAHFHFFGEDTLQTDEKIKMLFYRCGFELINNAVKYANAKNIDVQLIQEQNLISLTVADDGCGFDINGQTKGAGLQNLRDRIATFGGTFDIVSTIDEGTEAVVELRIES
jgi:signal transduction histidine kinase